MASVRRWAPNNDGLGGMHRLEVEPNGTKIHYADDGSVLEIDRSCMEAPAASVPQPRKLSPEEEFKRMHRELGFPTWIPLDGKGV